MKKIFFLLSIAIIGLTACSREEDNLFEDSASDRANQAISKYNDILTSAENGWVMQYYPSSNMEFGGYTVTLYFDKDGTVTAYSDVTDASSVATSLYQVKQSAGIVLSFDTYNEILHLFSDPSAPLGGSYGEGMGGDYEFNIIKASKKSVILKGKYSGNYAVMTPMTGEWNDLYNNLYFVEYTMTRNVYIMTIDQDSIIVTRSDRTLNFTYEENGEMVEMYMPYVITTEGMEFVEPLTIKGKNILGFAFKPEATIFASNDPSVNLSTEAPMSLQVLYCPWFISSYMSDGFVDAFTPAISWSAAAGERIGYMYLGRDGSNYGFNFWSSGYAGSLLYDVTIVNDTTISLDFTEKFADNGSWYYQNAYYDWIAEALSGTYTIQTDDPANPSVVVLTNEDGEYLMLSAKPVYFPFEQEEEEEGEGEEGSEEEGEEPEEEGGSSAEESGE